jgi:hypothetical protein
VTWLPCAKAARPRSIAVSMLMSTGRSYQWRIDWFNRLVKTVADAKMVGDAAS